MSDDFRRIASREIDEFKAEYRDRYPERDAEKITDEELLREVMNTVGKHGKLGEQIRCVVSVSMLTEGWDANTVTHILGIRALVRNSFASRLWAGLSAAPVGRLTRKVTSTRSMPKSTVFRSRLFPRRVAVPLHASQSP